MKTPARIVIVLMVAAAAIAAVALKKNKALESFDATSPPKATMAASPIETTSDTSAKLPKLLDLGAGKCIPCKMMAPILEELKKQYAGRMIVEFIDVWQNPDAGKAFNVDMIPTQIFYDPEGKELFRHTGFFGRDEILGKWKELGVDLAAPEKKYR
jgi:thioredoxin 1